MKEIDLKCWEEFEEHIDYLFAVKGHFKEVENRTYGTPIFRGQANASWELESTLDRVFKRDVGIEEYFKTIQNVRPAVISITGKEWNIPDNFDDKPFVVQGYDFMVYLRHHGFPSPLLDWTRSPFVAAYFAFRSYEDRNDSKVSLFSYAEYFEVGMIFDLEDKEPTIHQLGSHVMSHERHYAQQCRYTICTIKTDGNPVYTSHKHSIAKGKTGNVELVKYMLPTSERGKVLRKLERMNVTAFSLFGSEESLMETLAYQQIGKIIL